MSHEILDELVRLLLVDTELGAGGGRNGVTHVANPGAEVFRHNPGEPFFDLEGSERPHLVADIFVGSGVLVPIAQEFQACVEDGQASELGRVGAQRLHYVWQRLTVIRSGVQREGDQEETHVGGNLELSFTRDLKTIQSRCSARLDLHTEVAKLEVLVGSHRTTPALNRVTEPRNRGNDIAKHPDLSPQALLTLTGQSLRAQSPEKLLPVGEPRKKLPQSVGLVHRAFCGVNQVLYEEVEDVLFLSVCEDERNLRLAGVGIPECDSYD